MPRSTDNREAGQPRAGATGLGTLTRVNFNLAPGGAPLPRRWRTCITLHSDSDRYSSLARPFRPLFGGRASASAGLSRGAALSCAEHHLGQQFTSTEE